MDARSLRSYRAWLELGRYVATELCACLVAAYQSSLACPRGSIEIWTIFYCKALRKDIFTKITFRKNVYADFYGLSDIDSVVTDFDPNKGRLRVVISDKFWDLVSGCLILCLEMLETSALGLGQDLGLLLVLEGAMTNSTYVSRFSFILIPYRFKVRDRLSAYTTCMRYYPCVGCTRVISTRWLNVSAYDCLVFQENIFIEGGNFIEERIFRRLRRLAMLKICYSFVCRVSGLKCSRVCRCFAMLQGFSLSPAFEKHSCLTTNVRSQNCCSCLDANSFICDRGIMTEDVSYSSRSFVMNFSLHAAYYGESCLELLMEYYRSLFQYDLVAEQVDLANHREESAPFNVHDATSILEFSSSQMFSMFFRDLLGTTETERNALPEKASILWLIAEFQFDIGSELDMRAIVSRLSESLDRFARSG
ncbi:hypothetical protein IGI04_002975 [Brassica rapa subsp. trilocularis]|uniref:NTF2 domain-containing protein n=1 Tax=Brassica rapa subsp. trilocularis TaxID=1813537 RepID=A0ABQ7NX44_BRACM|nr:hypothetical protein IGI04_002975 [Brassica rapa subsp. trilocularis]